MRPLVAMLEFDPPDSDALRAEIQPDEKGFDAGERGVPAAGAPDDPAERQIFLRIRALGEEARSRLQHYLVELEGRRGQLRGTSPSQDLNRSLRDAEFEFRRIAQTEGPALREARVQADRRKNELQEFKRHHRLRRPARYPEFGKKIVFGAVVAALFLIESLANASFLSSGHELGLLGAYTVAFGISALNLVPAFFLFGPVSRGFAHVESGRRLFAGLCTAFYLLFAVVLNLGVAHYREVSGALLGNAGAAVVERMQTAPFSLQEAESWLLFGMGLLFSLVAFFEGRKFDDAYPDYGEVDRQHREASSAYDERVRRVTEDLDEVRQRTLDGFKRLVHDSKSQPQEERTLGRQRRAAARNYAAYLDELDSVAQMLIVEYRNANHQARTDGEIPLAHRAPPGDGFAGLRAAVPGGDEEESEGEGGEAGRLDEEYGRATDRVHRAHEAALAQLLGESPPAGPPAESEPSSETEGERAPAPALPAPDAALKLPEG